MGDDAEAYRRARKRVLQQPVIRRTHKIRLTPAELKAVRRALRPGEELSVLIRGLVLGFYERSPGALEEPPDLS